MKFDDLKVEYIKTIVASQRVVCLPSGYALSFMGDDNSLISGDGVCTFEVKVFKHNAKLTEPTDLFNSYLSADCIDFSKPLFIWKWVNKETINMLFKLYG